MNEYIIRKNSSYSEGWEIEINNQSYSEQWHFIPCEDTEDFDCFKSAAVFVVDFLT